jgi:hypothetical protein
MCTCQHVEHPFYPKGMDINYLYISILITYILVLITYILVIYILSIPLAGPSQVHIRNTLGTH